MTPVLVSGKGEQNQNKSKKKRQKPKPSYFLKHWCRCTTNVKEASSLAKSHNSYEIRGRLFTFPCHSFFKCWIGKLLLILWSLGLFQEHEQSPAAVFRRSSHIYLYHRERRTSLPIGNFEIRFQTKRDMHIKAEVQPLKSKVVIRWRWDTHAPRILEKAFIYLGCRVWSRISGEEGCILSEAEKGAREPRTHWVERDELKKLTSWSLYQMSWYLQKAKWRGKGPFLGLVWCGGEEG